MHRLTISALVSWAILAGFGPRYSQCSAAPATKAGDATPTKLPRNATRNIVNSIGIEFVLVPAGEFIMGLPDRGQKNPPDVPEHRVRITKPFYLGAHEITQRHYRKIMRFNPSWHQPTGGAQFELGVSDTAEYPVEQVSWDQAADFCKRLSQLPAEVKARRSYALPTEAQWEYACRAGNSAPHEPEKTPSADEKQTSVRPVGAKLSNEFGLFDMQDNIWEWCADWYARDYYKTSTANDPEGPSSGLLRVVRGRPWIFTGNDRKFASDATPASHKSQFLGFRVICKQLP